MFTNPNLSHSEILELIYGNCCEGLIIVDAEGIVRYFNQAMERITGIGRDRVIGRHVSQYSRISRLPAVLVEGEPQLDVRCKGFKKVIMNRIPSAKTDGLSGHSVFTSSKNANLKSAARI